VTVALHIGKISRAASALIVFAFFRVAIVKKIGPHQEGNYHRPGNIPLFGHADNNKSIADSTHSVSK
jgi:hypothetical protein